MSDIVHGITFAVSDISKVWKLAEYLSLFSLLVLKINNPIFKIGLALHVGLQVMLILLYSPMVYFKLIEGGQANNKQVSLGLIQKFVSFVPNMMYKLSRLALKLLITLLAKLTGASFKNVNIEPLASVITYLYIMLRKTLALVVSIYVTSEDDESKHTKAFAVYAVFVLIEMKYVKDLMRSSSAQSSRPSITEILKSIVKLDVTRNDTKSNQSTLNGLQTLRSRLLTVTALVVVFFLYLTFNNALEFIDDDKIWIATAKTIVMIDALFIESLIVELLGLDLKFLNKNNTLV
ncbi:hypothetical protein BOH78_3304 [Pichia kudriavzevii]|uniref:Uncharacterized protein n=1 Tax=Pichia kudriavzevii TaxID=4909 RepID=A0A099NZH1_PICKU|nr:hypothetical protein JL09_g3520 [Pichia kudriavzevii]ONH73153.1 hypothetical protein BOH78_3304 [Pichia kudriavzevii]